MIGFRVNGRVDLPALSAGALGGAIASLLRHDHSVTVLDDGHFIPITQTDTGGVYYGDRRLPITTFDASPRYVWEALRVLYESLSRYGTVGLSHDATPAAGCTVVVVSGRIAERVFASARSYLLKWANPQPADTLPGLDIYAGPASAIYVNDRPVIPLSAMPSRLTYNLWSPPGLALDNMLFLKTRLLDLVTQSRNAMILNTVLAPGDGWFEDTLPWPQLPRVFGRNQLFDWCLSRLVNRGSLKLNDNARRLYPLVARPVDLRRQDVIALRPAMRCLEDLGLRLDFRDFHFVDSLPDGALATHQNGHLYLSRDAAEASTTDTVHAVIAAYLDCESPDPEIVGRVSHLVSRYVCESQDSGRN